jgi:hypothetical protein
MGYDSVIYISEEAGGMSSSKKISIPKLSVVY